MRSGERRWQEYTEKDDQRLVAYIARYNPGEFGRQGNKLYQALVGNVDKWPWVARHSWHSWRERYKKRREFFDEEIPKYQKEHKISTSGHQRRLSRVSQPATERRGVRPTEDTSDSDGRDNHQAEKKRRYERNSADTSGRRVKRVARRLREESPEIEESIHAQPGDRKDADEKSDPEQESEEDRGSDQLEQDDLGNMGDAEDAVAEVGATTEESLPTADRNGSVEIELAQDSHPNASQGTTEGRGTIVSNESELEVHRLVANSIGPLEVETFEEVAVLGTPAPQVLNTHDVEHGPTVTDKPANNRWRPQPQNGTSSKDDPFYLTPHPPVRCRVRHKPKTLGSRSSSSSYHSHHSPTVNSSRSSKRNNILSTPSSIAPTSRDDIWRAGVNFFVRRMSENHGFTQSVVHRLFNQMNSLKEVDRTLYRMREKAEAIAAQAIEDFERAVDGPTPSERDVRQESLQERYTSVSPEHVLEED